MGEPPKVEVTVENLNDNVEKQFLSQMVTKFGIVELMDIYYHPKTQKHLGAAFCWDQDQGLRTPKSYFPLQTFQVFLETLTIKLLPVSRT